MKNIKELLEILLKRIESNECEHGLCMEVGRVNINVSEYRWLKQYIDNNRPKIFQSGFAPTHILSSYYWKKGDKAPRIKWLKQHIKKNS